MDAASPHYTVLARRFRPQTFAEVVGQSHVAQALKNAIAGGRVAHAYLFTGARGVGKTSMARILAKALNCPRAVDGDPCNECEICQGIASGHDVDVLEIDGASNRRIDDIRLLRSNVGVKPMRAKYKIYIIDEVHMLTNEAFNALLKTLEEPPANVKFIFCTTEPNKVPDTILSRCQRFDFAAVATQQIVERLYEIAAAEKYEVEPAALELVARRAGGSMRDSQSLFDQLLAYAGGSRSITVEDVHRLLGTASDERLIQMAECVINQQSNRALEQLDQALAEGVQLGEFVDQLLDYHRDLMVVAAGAESTALASVASGTRPTLAAQAQRWGLPTVVAALQLLAETKTRMQRSGHGRALAELALVRLTLLEATLDLATLADELRSSPAGVPDSKSKPGPRPPQPAAVPRQSGVSRTLSGPPVGDSTATNVKASRPKASEPATNAPLEVSPTPLIPGREADVWSQVLDRLNVKDMLRDSAGKAVNVAIIGPNHLEILFPAEYHLCKEFCEQPTALDRLQKLATDVVGQSVRLTFRLLERSVEAKPKSTTPAPNPGPPKEGEKPRQLPTDINDSYAEKAKTLFGATIVRVESLAKRKREGGGDSDGTQEE